MKSKIFELGDIDLDVKKVYITFKGRRNIIDVEFTKNKLRCEINMKKGSLIDPINIAIDIGNIGHWGNGDYRVELYNKNDIDKIISLVKQSFEVNKK